MGNPTVGEIPEHWEFTTLGEVCDRGEGKIQTGPFGSQLHASDYVPVGIPSIMPVNIGDNRLVESDIKRITEEDVERLSKHRVVPGDIIYSRRGDVERRAIVREEERGWLCGTGCMKVRLGQGVVDPPFASFYLDHPQVREWIVQHAVGATMPNLNTSIMRSIPFALPPLSEQRAIASILGALDDKIELNRRMNATLESLARAIFKSWFVDFDPVRSKSGQQAEPPSGTGAATATSPPARDLSPDTSPAPSPFTLPPSLFNLFPSTFQDSDLGKIPEGWSVQSLADMSELLSGGTPKKSNESCWNGELPWISPKAMMTMHAFESDAHVTVAAVGNGTRLVPMGTVLVMVRGMGLHKGIRISQARRDLTFNQDVKALVPTTVSGDFILFAMLDAAPYLFGKVQASGHGTGVIPTDILQSLRFAVPPNDVLEKLTAPLTDINCRIHANTMESLTLSTLRDTLLPKLLSGELPVPAALTATSEALASVRG